MLEYSELFYYQNGIFKIKIIIQKRLNEYAIQIYIYFQLKKISFVPIPKKCFATKNCLSKTFDNS
jgi:hypothetical protein